MEFKMPIIMENKESQNVSNEIKCSICKKHLSTKQSLKQHLNMHLGLQPFQCKFDKCGSKFKYASQLSDHKKTHMIADLLPEKQFYNLKCFARLLIQIFGDGKPKNVTFKGIKIPKVKIPKIGEAQIGVQLPIFGPLINSSS